MLSNSSSPTPYPTSLRIGKEFGVSDNIPAGYTLIDEQI